MTWAQFLSLPRVYKALDIPGTVTTQQLVKVGIVQSLTQRLAGTYPAQHDNPVRIAQDNLNQLLREKT